ncbi:sigma-54 interaction domain-containing protein [Candidatus Moduliflexota bacterium]
MSPLITGHIILGTLCLTLGLLHLLISFRKEDSRADSLFSLMAIGVAAGLYIDTWMYRATLVSEFNTAFKIHISFDVLLWISMIWFIAAYTGTARRPLLAASTLCYAAAAVINILSPYGILYGEITGLETMTLPWGESVVYAVGSLNPLRYVADAGWILLIVLSGDSCVRLYRRGERGRALTLGSALFLVLIVAYLYGTLMDLGILGPPNLVPFTFLALLLIMSASLTGDVVRASRLGRQVKRDEYRWRSLLENVQLFVFGANRDGIVNFTNPYYLKVSGYTAEEVIGRHFSEFLSEKDRGQMTEAFRGALQSGPRSFLLVKLRAKDGMERTALLSSVLLHDAEGSLAGTMSIGADITRRIEAEEERDRVIEELEALKKQLEEENVSLREEISSSHGFTEIIGESNALLYVLGKVKQVAATDSTVLLLGETGVGKELIAEAIHRESARSKEPFIRVNCAALPATLIESEFFGHEPGAFTDARTLRRGRFELADGGTILLDEIAEIPPETQAKLLRVIQEGRFERIGGSKTLTVDTRIIAATNRDLQGEVSTGRFRADLYYRLSVFPITVPPLRSRREDIPLLVQHHVPLISARVGRVVDQVTPTVMERLSSYGWPGNVRELHNVLEQGVITSRDSVLHLPEGFGEQTGKTSPPSSDGWPSLEEMERDYIMRVLEKCGGRIEGSDGAAPLLGLKPSTLRSRLRKLGLDLKTFR